MKTKKSKRIISLVLALTMVFTFMAMSASAATTEVQPRGTCPNCTHGYINSTLTPIGDPVAGPLQYCPNLGAKHAHYTQTYYIVATCPVCKYVEESYINSTYCPHA